MPIVIDGKTFDSFEEAVAHVKRTKPEITSPEGYVATVERKQRGAKIEELKARIAAVVGRPKTQKERQEEANTYAYEMGRRLGTGEQGLPDLEKNLKGLTKYVATGTKIRPPKPTQMERRKIISAKQETEIECPKTNLAKLKTRLDEIKIAKEHKHAIQFKQAKRIGETGEFRGATQEKYWKYWLLNAKQTNGNGWGVSSDSIDSNISKFIGRPFCVTAKQWFPESEYETYEHPYLPTNNLDIIFSHQAKYSVGDIVDVMKDANGDYYAMIKPHSKFASHSPPAFCSPAIFQLDPHEPENKISKWEALHLAGLDRDPAYGAQIALLKGTCVGTANECKVQFKSAKQQNAGVGLPKGFDEHKSDTDVSPFILPKYSEADYEAYRDYVQDSAFHVEDAADAGLEEEDAIESSKYRWKNMPEEYKQVLRPYYQKQMAHELPWQKDPEQYVSGKIPAENQVYIKPNFHKNLKPRYDDLTEKYPNFDYLRHRDEVYGEYLDIDPKDIIPKTTRAFDNPEKYAKMKSKVRSALISTGPNESKPNTKSKRIDKIVPYFEKPPMEGMSESDAEAEDKAISEYIIDSKKINPKELGRNKINPKLKSKLAIVKSPDKPKVDRELKHTRVDSNGPLINKVPFGNEDRTTQEQYIDRQLRDFSYEQKDKKVYPPKPTQKDRKRIIAAKQQVAGFPRLNPEVILQFKNKQTGKRGSLESTGDKLFYNKHEIARHHPNGIQVSLAGYNTPTTKDALRTLGVHVQDKGGVTFINKKPYDSNSGKFVLVPHTDISKEKIVLGKPSTSTLKRSEIEDQSKFRDQVRKIWSGSPKKIPEDPTVIQPQDQKLINSITGVKSKIPKRTLGTDAHHIFSKDTHPALRLNPNNGIPLSKSSHDEVHEINKDFLRKNINMAKLKNRVALAKQRLAVSYNKHYIFDEFTPRQYGRDDVPSLLDRVADDVEQHASVIGKKILDSGNLHPKSYSKLADTFDSMTRDTLLRIQNNYGNDFEDIQGNEHDIFANEAENVAETGKYLHRKDFGMENPEEIRRPEGAAEQLGEALLEPFRRMKEEHMAGVPKEDYFKGNKLIERFSNELYGRAYQSLQKRSGMLGASQKNAFLNPNTTKQKWMRFIYRGKEECEICRQFDGKVYRTDDENRPVIPRMEEWNGSGPITHPNCKCMWAKTFSEEGLKSQERRKVPIFSFRLSKSDKTRSELIQHALNRKAAGAAKEDIFEDLIDNQGADGVTARQVVESINWKSKNAKLDILKAKLEDMQKTNTFGQHSVIDQEGNILEKSGYDHYDMARDYFGLKADKSGNRPDVSDYDIHKMLSENNWVRVQNFSRSRNPHLSIHVAKPITPQQAKTLLQLHEDNPNTDVGYFIGPTVETAINGSAPSMKQVLMESRKAFGTAKTAQEVHPFVTQYKEYRKNKPADPKGFTYSPRLGRDLTTDDMLKVGDGTAVHYIGISNNKEAPVEETSSYIQALQDAGEEPHIGGWTDKGVNYIDASYALVTDNPHEVQRHLIKHGQDAAYTVLPDGRTPTTWNLEKHPDVPDEDKSNPFNTKSYFLKFKP